MCRSVKDHLLHLGRCWVYTRRRRGERTGGEAASLPSFPTPQSQFWHAGKATWSMGDESKMMCQVR